MSRLSSTKDKDIEALLPQNWLDSRKAAQHNRPLGFEVGLSGWIL